MQNNKKNTGLKVALGIAVILFVAVGLYSVNLFNEKKQNETQLTKEKELVMANLSEMAKQYDEAIKENSVNSAKLQDAKARIEGLLDSLKTAETNVKSLWRYKQKYLSLQKEMDMLLAENDSLKVENQLLATTLDSTKIKLEERTIFTDSLLIQNTALAKVVEDASILQAVNLKSFGVIERTSGKLVPTTRAKRSDKIRVCFTIPSNTLVSSGDKALYIQIIDPKNNTLGADKEVLFDEKILNYSSISKFNYENSSLDVCELVKAKGNDGFEKGIYLVNIFNNDKLVAKTQFELK